MSLMWIRRTPTVPPLASAFSASGTSPPTGAKMIAASSACGGCSSEAPAHTAPSSSANACAAVSPARVKAYTSRPCQRATWAMMWAEAPKPYRPRRRASPHSLRAR